MICNTKENLLKAMETMPFFQEGNIVDLPAFLEFIEETKANAILKYATNKNLHPIKEIEGTKPVWNEDYFKETDINVHLFNIQNQERLGTVSDLTNVPEENLKKPVNVNYFEFINHKQAQLTETRNRKKRAQTQYKQKGTALNRSKLKKLTETERVLENQLEALREQEEDFMFNAIEEDLGNLNTILNGSDIGDLQEVRETLDFYEEFMTTILESEKAASIIKDIVTAKEKYREYTLKVVNESMADSELIKKTLKNLNDTREPGAPAVTLADLNKANKDLSLADSYFLGISSSTTGDTLLPQHLQQVFRQAFAYHNEKVKRIIDKLDAFNLEHPEVDREQLFEYDADGNKTGHLIDLYNSNWYKGTTLLKNLVSNFYSAKNTDKYAQHNKIVDWYERNAEILDISMLPEVQAIYGGSHPEKFVHSEEQMATYQKGLKDQLGARYQDIINDTLRSIKEFEEFKLEADPDNAYTNKNIAQRDLWQYTSQFNRGEGKKGIAYTHLMGQSEVLFSAFNTLPLIPKKADNIPNYYSGVFSRMGNERPLIKLWKIYKEMAEQIDSTYAMDNMGRVKYPKFKTQFSESIEQQLTSLKKGKIDRSQLSSTFMEGLTTLKSTFYEQGVDSRNSTNIVDNYGDATKKEIQDLTRVYMIKGLSEEVALRKAKGVVLDKYSVDLDRNFKALLVQSAMHDARLETAPIAESILEVFSGIKGAKGQTRENAIKRLTHYVDKIIMNKSVKERGTDSTAGADLTNNSETLSNVEKYFKFLEGTKVGNRLRGGSTLFKLLSETDKIILEEIRSYDINSDKEFSVLDGATNLTKVKGDNGFVYAVDNKSKTKEEFERALEKYFNNKVKSLGKDLNIAGVVDGLLKTQIIKSLGLNPIGGIFNRVEGMFSIMIMDQTGEFWSPGNGDIAKEFMAFANITKMSSKRFSFINKDKRKQLEVFDALLQRLDVLQDRKDELQKSTDKSQVSLSNVPIFSWAVDNPEYKNQGTTILAVLMDKHITNNKTGEVVKLFDGEKFNGVTLTNGILTVDPDFQASFSLDGQDMLDTVVELEQVVSRVQGNYNPLDVMLAKQHWYGRAGMLFKTWFPESFNKRWGRSSQTNSKITPEYNINLAGQQEKREGYMLRATKSNPMAMAGYIAGTIGLSFGAANLALALGGTALAGVAIHQAVKTFSSGEVVKQDASAIIDLGRFVGETAIEMVNIPSRIGSSLKVGDMGLHKLRTSKSLYSKTNMTPEDVGATKALARELAIMASALLAKLSLGLLLFDEEDEKTSHKRKFHNMVQNQLSRSITTLSVYSDPSTLVNDASSLMLERTVSNLILTAKAVVYDQDLDKAGGHFVKTFPLPDTVTKLGVHGKLPWEDNANYDFINFTGDNITKPMKWLSTYIEVSDESKAKKEVTRLRRELTEELKEKEPGMDKQYYRNEVMSRYPAKKKGDNYVDLLKEYSE